MAILSRTRTLLLLHHHHHHLTKSITTFPFTSQEPQLAEPSPPPTTTTTTTSLPPNPASGIPLYYENPQSARPPSSFAQSSIIPHGFFNLQHLRIQQTLANRFDSNSLMNLFAVLTASKRWADITALFEAWLRSIDIKTGKRKKPDVNLFNSYLRAKLMNGASTYEMVDLVEQMDDFRIAPNFASFKLVLKAYQAANEAVAIQQLIELIERFTERFDFNEKDLASEENLWDLYERWMSYYNVSRSPEEKHKRFNAFKAKAMRIHNTNKMDNPYRLGLTKFGDFTHDEYMTYNRLKKLD